MSSNKCSWIDAIIFILSFSFPLIMIALAISVSPWFNILNNALSDLGHAVKSGAAPIFNLGLAIGGILIIMVGLRNLYMWSKIKGSLIISMGIFLNLIGVFDEVYGWIHFLVSVLFFLSIITYFIALSILDKSWIAVLLIISHIVMWYMHFALRIPRGAAVPELLAVFTFLPFYIRDYLKSYNKQ
ncbi:DUF998 domain-containing protein [Staphylothermus hellenicus]|uniref:DUF998 domain-containing protein n=1 Tax=Staphylothermus hellenicus (strain DSM 12710 / JCM 10830 / BK20S6-10-b1 / P8) TaxID=591019 RepID=D7DBI1_STAHD|nr:DUF998 domain-containing protein [Staphylothermus hellenicus]ADI31528.1 Protein of unknown function DUF998 [Staphylothermus hellenicus DSM 12710]